MAESFPDGYKTQWEKEKLLVTSNFSFSHSVFKRLVQQTHKNQGLFGKGLSFSKGINSIPSNKFQDSSKLKEFADDNFKFDENGIKFPNGQKTLWEKEKLLVTSNFSCSHSVFKRLLKTGKNGVVLERVQSSYQ